MSLKIIFFTALSVIFLFIGFNLMKQNGEHNLLNTQHKVSLKKTYLSTNYNAGTHSLKKNLLHQKPDVEEEGLFKVFGKWTWCAIIMAVFIFAWCFQNWPKTTTVYLLTFITTMSILYPRAFDKPPSRCDNLSTIN